MRMQVTWERGQALSTAERQHEAGGGALGGLPRSIQELREGVDEGDEEEGCVGDCCSPLSRPLGEAMRSHSFGRKVGGGGSGPCMPLAAALLGSGTARCCDGVQAVLQMPRHAQWNQACRSHGGRLLLLLLLLLVAAEMQPWTGHPQQNP
jgi:hypothetical protein